MGHRIVATNPQRIAAVRRPGLISRKRDATLAPPKSCDKTRMTHNARKALTSLFKSLVLMGAMLFLLAWSVRYVEGWIFLIVLGTLSAAIILYLEKHDPALLERRMKAGPADEKEPSQKRIQLATSIVGILIVALPGLDHRFHWSDMPVSVIMLGFAGFALGYLIVFLVFRENTYTSGIIEIADGQHVISTGPYAIVRHPMYTGANLCFLSMPLALGSWWALIPAAIECVLVGVRAIDEEKFLKAHLPGYQDYCETVRYRLIPGVW
jgi:protein-S-isoprenylcysteine O-methyltransferase Ste14